WGWYSYGLSEADRLGPRLRERLHHRSYLEALDGIDPLIDLPDWDEQRGCSADVPDLDPHFRIGAIADNRLFPPLWRLRACRTLLPDEVGPQVAQWRSWVDQVMGGQQDNYVRELHVHDLSDLLRYHRSLLREQAAWSRR